MQLRRYYYLQLSSIEKKVYDDIYMGLMVHREQISTVYIKNAGKSLARIMKAIQYDHPEIYYVERGYSYTCGTTQMVVYVRYIYSASQRKFIDQRITRQIRKITKPVSNAKLDTYRKERYLYEYFASHYSYDHRNIPKRKKKAWNNKYSILGAIEDNKAVCEGFAKTFKLMMDRMGLECMIVVGYSDHARAGQPGKDGRHAWNIVYLNGNCYHVDVTWGICSSSSNQICYDYLNLTDRQIRRDHKGFGGIPICSIG